MAPRIFAVCIGINFYPDPDTPSLSACVSDCDSIISYLTEVLEVPATQITRLTSTKHRTEYRAIEDSDHLATYQNITKALLKLSQEREKDDQVLVTYSGHGSRDWTIVPGWRGKNNHMDEGLVPMDVYLPGGRFLRDFELSYLLGMIVKKECRLTVVLDSCHSGGAFRAPQRETGRRVRKTELINMTQDRDPAQQAAANERYAQEKPLGGVSLDQLQEHWDMMQDRTENVPKHQWLVKPFGYEIWTGCLQHELSWEIAGSGRLTGALVDSLRSSRNPTTTSLGLLYRNVYDLTYDKNWYRRIEQGRVMHQEPILQTPILLGDVDRGFLTEYAAPKQIVGIPIHAVPYNNYGAEFTPFDASEHNDFPTLILRAGSAHGVQKGSEYAVYLWDEKLNNPLPESRIKVVITHVGTVASVVRLTGSPDLSLFEQVSIGQHTRQSNRMDEYYKSDTWLALEEFMYPQNITFPWPSGCQAVLASGPPANVKRVRLVATGGTPFPAPWDGATNKYVRAEVPLLIVSTGENFQVKSNDGQYEVHDAGSDAVLSKADSVEKALRNIVHISQYRTWFGLEGSGTRRDKDNIDLFTFTLEKPERVPGEGNTEKIKLKFKIDLDYVNTYGSAHANLALFHFSPNFGIRQIYPQVGQFETIDAGDLREISFEREIPEVGPGKDVVKAVVYQCSTGFKMWELPELGKEGQAGQPVRQSMELSLSDSAPEEEESEDNAVADWEAQDWDKYWLLQEPISGA